MSFTVKNDTFISIQNLGTTTRLTLYNYSRRKTLRPLSWNNAIENFTKRKMKEPRFDVETGELIIDDDNIRRSLQRAKNAVVDLARLNYFEYFGTITINDNLQDVRNPYTVIKNLQRQLDYYHRKNPDFAFLFVPELGEKNGRLHFHFLMKGFSPADIVRNEHRKLDLPFLRKKFGFIQITKIDDGIQNHENVARYCSKYITKGNIKLGKHRYFCSRNLKRPERVIVTKEAIAKTIEKALAPYEKELCYYNERCKSYSIPKIIVDRLKTYLKAFFHFKNTPNGEQVPLLI